MNLSVPNAVWLATALLTYEKFKTGTVETFNDVAFKQSIIQKYVKKFKYKNVYNARIYQQTNGDHGANTYNYLSAVGSERRLTALGEFDGYKEQPDLQSPLKIKLNGQTEQITVEELNHFNTQEYAPFINSHLYPTVNFEKIIEHLQTYANEKGGFGIEQNTIF